MKRIAVLTSGGRPNRRMLPSVQQFAKQSQKECSFGIYDGYAGMAAGEIYPLDAASVGDIISRGGFLHSYLLP